MVNTKIIATIGPASLDAPVLDALIDAGVDVFRLNFSHGTLDQHLQAVGAIRDAAARRGAIVAIMGDLCGPKIRLETVPPDLRRITTGQTIRFTRYPQPGVSSLTTSYSGLIDEVTSGQRILIDDGNVALRVEQRLPDELLARCDVGGDLSDHKGVNLPDTCLTLPSLTSKDLADLAWALDQRLDYIALSFVRTPDDISGLRNRIRAAGGDARIVAKIEKPEAISHLAGIIDACDVLLVARGDLGVEMDVARVPLLQKDMIRRCRYAGRPVIVATQMLQSMVTQPTPTRAEVSDVANAILDGADAVMLSAETAVGRYPVAAVDVIRRIAEQIEPLLHRHAGQVNAEVMAATLRLTSGVVRGAAMMARDLESRVVAVWTRVGNTPRLLSKHRLPMPVIGLSPDDAVCRRMAMYYGVVPVQLPLDLDESAMLARLDALLVERGLAESGDLALIVLGTELTRPGSTNVLLVHLIDQGAAVSREAT